MLVENNGKLYVIKKEKRNYQKGGRVLGEGSFGCVVTPPLHCNNPFFRMPYSIDKNYVSKIVEYDEDDEDILNELKFGKKLVKLDPRQKYFSPIINGCLLEEQKHQDLKYLSSKKNSFNNSSYFNSSSMNNTSNNQQNDKKETKCYIYLSEDYLNLISKNAGVNLKIALTSKMDKVQEYFRNNYKHIMHHFCDGLMILHKNNILHKDLKPYNVMINFQSRRPLPNIIDFGLSEELKHKITLKDFRYLITGGTELYTPVEIFMVLYMIKEIKKNKNIVPRNLKSSVLNKVREKFKQNRDYYLERFHFGQPGFVYDGDKLNKKIDKSVRRKYKRYCNREDRYAIYYHLLKDFNNDVLVQNFTGNFGHLYKWDVFAMGLIFAEMIVRCNIEDELAYDLINKMVNTKYWERYDIKECLNHPLFKADGKKQSKTKKKSKRKNKTLTTTRKQIKNVVKEKVSQRKNKKASENKSKSKSKNKPSKKKTSKK